MPSSPSFPSVLWKSLVGLPCLFACAAGAALAAEVKLPMELGTLTTRDNKVYENAKIVGKDAIGVKVAHDAGTARIPYVRLPRELADQFQVNPGAAAEQLRKEAKNAAAHDQAVAAAMAEAEANAIENPSPQDLSDPAKLKAALPEHMRSTAFEAMLAPRDETAGVRIKYLEAFIERTFRSIDQTKAQIEQQNKLAAAAFEKGRAEEQEDVKSRRFSNRRPSRDYPGLREGERINQWISKEKEKIAEAEGAISKAAAEIRSLRKSSSAD